MKELYAIDSECTLEKDDAFNVNISNNEATIKIAMPYMLDLNKKDLKTAKRKGLSKYKQKDYMFSKNIIKKKTLKDGINKVFLFTCILNIDTLEVLSYDFSISSVNIKCFNFDNYTDIENIDNIKLVSAALEKRRLNMNKLIYIRPSLKIDNDSETILDHSNIKRMIASYMLLINELAAKQMKKLNIGKEFTKKDSLILRYQNKVFFEKNITNKHASKYTNHELLLSNLFLSSTNFNNDKFDNYTYVTSPLRRYVDIIVQDIIINNNTNYSLFDNDNNYNYYFQTKEAHEKKDNLLIDNLSKYHYYRYRPTYGKLILKVKDKKYYQLDTNEIVISKDKYYNNVELLTSVYYDNKLIFTSRV